MGAINNYWERMTGAFTKAVRAIFTSKSYQLIRMGIGLCFLFMLTDLLLDVFVFHEGSVLQQVLAPEPYEIWLRFNVVTMILIFSFYAQIVTWRLQINQVKLEQELMEHKKMDELFIESEERYRLLVDKSPYGISIHQDGKIVFANQAAVSQIGAKSMDDLVGKPISLFIHPDTWEATRSRIMRMLQGEAGLYPIQDLYVRLDGSVIPVEVTAAPFTFKGRPAIQVIAMDISDRIQTEQALRESESKFRSYIENAPMGVFTIDQTGNFVVVNPATEKMLGYKKSEFEGVSILSVLPSQFAETGQQLFEKVVREGSVSAEMQVRRKDGSLFWITAQAVRLQNNEIMAFCQDITQRKQVEEKVQSQVHHLEALRRIDDTITGTFDMSLSLNIVLEQALLQLQIDAACVLLLNPYSLTLTYASGRGFRTDAMKSTNLRLGEGYAGQAAMNKQVVFIPDIREASTSFNRSPHFPEDDFISYYAIPLVAKGKVEGVLEVFQRSLLKADPEWLDFLETLAKQTAIAIDNANLFEGLSRANDNLVLAYDETIEGWSQALDLRDKETEGHTKRVTEMTVRLGRAMGMPESEIVHVRRGSLLHDIGKMGVPDAILLKPGQLTDEEMVLMRQHPIFAYSMLYPIAYLHSAMDIPYCHHEKWDGTGYPRGLKGGEIPLSARIFAVVDIWDALLSDRPYRAGWPKEKVFEHIRSLSGTHLDPKAVELFLKVAS
jgi:PAS domain S-box-containing protein